MSRRLLLGAGIGAALPWPALAAEPSAVRIASIGGAVTEILYALGLGDHVAAVDTTSLHPPEAMRTKPSVGYLRQLSAEGILSVRPSLAIAAEGAGPPDVLKLVREAGVPIVSVSEEPTEAGVLARIAVVARAVGREEQGRALTEETRRQFAELGALRARIVRPTRTLFILSLQNGRLMVGGRATTADGMLSLAGAENVARSIEGYKPMTDEAVVAAAPEAIVMMAHNLAGTSPAELFEGPALSRVPAAQGKRLVAMDGLYLLGFGPRTPLAARDLLVALHPGTKAE